jgi:hypothetical protein
MRYELGSMAPRWMAGRGGTKIAPRGCSGRVHSAQAIGHWWGEAQDVLLHISSEAHQKNSPTQHRCRFLFFSSLSWCIVSLYNVLRFTGLLFSN